jgi:UDP-N-acetylmuramate dehydrogenase
VQGADWVHEFSAERDVPLRDLTTVHVGGQARWLVRPKDALSTAQLLKRLTEFGLSWRILGGGSNLLVADGEVGPVVVHMVGLQAIERAGAELIFGAGVALQRAVNLTTDEGLAGAEVLTGIPGQIGGALAMNAGGRYGEMAGVVRWAEVALATGALERISAAALNFGYRSTHLPLGAVVTRVALGLQPSEDRSALKRRAGAILKEKNAAQPTQAWNFGCMFKNPEGQSAGKLIEAAGLKGRVQGGARISPRHGNFIENLGAAKAEEVLSLIRLCELEVQRNSGIRLEREVRVWEPLAPPASGGS